MKQLSGYQTQEYSLEQFRKALIFGSIITLALIFLFAYVARVVFSTSDILLFDSVIIDWVQSFVSDSATPIMIAITEIGYIYVIIPIILIALFILLFIKKHFWEAVFLVVAIGGGDIIKVIFKHFFHRERPSIFRVIEETGFSFPSGHSMAAITFYGMLAYIIWINIPHRKGLRIFISIFAPFLILFIGISRIYLGVHYPSDVIAGFAVGGAWLTTCIMALNAIRYYKSDARKALKRPISSKY